MTPYGRKVVAGLVTIILTVIGACLTQCSPKTVEDFCHNFLGRSMPKELQPGQKAPPCGPDGMKFPHSEGCWTIAMKRPDPTGDCGDNLVDDPDNKGRCFAILPASKPRRIPVQTIHDGQPDPPSWTYQSK